MRMLSVSLIVFLFGLTSHGVADSLMESDGNLLPICFNRPVPEGVSKKKVLIVAIGGLDPNALTSGLAPKLQEIQESSSVGTSLVYAEPMAEPKSPPGWATILTGVWPDKHGVKGDDYKGFHQLKFPGFLTRLEEVKPELSTFSAVSTRDLYYTGLATTDVDSCFTEFNSGGWADKEDDAVKNKTVEVLREHNPDVVFVQFDNTDAQGYALGTLSREYLEAVKIVDLHVKDILDALYSRPKYSDEEWTIIVTTNRGNNIEGKIRKFLVGDRNVFVMVSGFDLNGGRIDVSLVDVFPTVFEAVEVSVKELWALDGKSFTEWSEDAFDQQYQFLNTATSLSDGIDTSSFRGVYGWSPLMPYGFDTWTTATWNGGAEEFAGWVLQTADFWTAYPKMRAEWREANVRSRGVFAVADADAYFHGWDKAGNEALFNATLISPKFEVQGVMGVLRFVSHHRRGRTSEAKVGISWNDEEPAVFVAMEEDHISQVVEVPFVAGVDKECVKFHFMFKGYETDWYWAIDDLRVQWKATKVMPEFLA